MRSKVFFINGGAGRVICSIPGLEKYAETNDDFMDTYNFLNDLDISYLHVFTYSERPNTDAIDLGKIVPGKMGSIYPLIPMAINIIPKTKYIFLLNLLII